MEYSIIVSFDSVKQSTVQRSVMHSGTYFSAYAYQNYPLSTAFKQPYKQAT